MNTRALFDLAFEEHAAVDVAILEVGEDEWRLQHVDLVVEHSSAEHWLERNEFGMHVQTVAQLAAWICKTQTAELLDMGLVEERPTRLRLVLDCELPTSRLETGRGSDKLPVDAVTAPRLDWR